MSSLKAYCSFLSIVFTLNIASLCAQINGPSTICKNAINNYSFKPGSGLSISSIQWTFGNGNTSNNTTPSYAYSNPGKYTIHAFVTYSNNSTVNDSLAVEVFDLPKAYFYPLPQNDSCLKSNRICFRDTSSPANPSQTIVNRLMVWGDGSFNNAAFPKKGQDICYKYTLADKYTVRMEIKDNKGCLSTVSKEIAVIESVIPGLEFTSSFSDCQTKQLCIRNNSTSAALNKAKFRWLIDSLPLDSNTYLINRKCLNYKSNKTIQVKLFAFVNPVCMDSISDSFTLEIDALPKKLFIKDTMECYGANTMNLTSIPDVKRDDIRWFVDNKNVSPFNKSNINTFSNKLTPGTHQAAVQIVRGTCTITLIDSFKILGPVAVMRLYDNIQCFGNRDVFMVDNSLGIQRENCKFLWKIQDPYGEACIQERTKDINKFKNCNISKDWFNKHIFSKQGGSSQITLIVSDTVNNCVDSSFGIVEMNACSPILEPDTLEMCADAKFFDNTLPPYPYKYSLDSGMNWHVFSSNVFHQPGTYKTSYIFRTVLLGWAEHYGDDSIKTHPDSMIYHDTIINHQTLLILEPRKDSIYIRIDGKCKPYTINVFFTNSTFYPGEKITILWPDNKSYSKTFTDTTLITNIAHTINRPINGDVKVITVAKNGCQNLFQEKIAIGKSMFIIPLKHINCLEDKICFNARVFDSKKGVNWYRNTSTNYIEWIFPDTSAPVTRWNPCYKFTTSGMQPFKVIAYDEYGCADTLIDSVFIQDVKANVSKNATYIFCSELKQFYDSSSFILNPSYRKNILGYYVDSIIFYSWQFGNGSFSSLKKNPLQSINTSADSVDAALAVRTVSGCMDTFKFNIRVIGTKPYFTLYDTIGCNQLTVNFVNKSRNCKEYIWSFGDSNQTILQRFDKQNIQFTYDKPGRYSISLIGIDTIFNPFTQSFQYCASSFPDKIIQKDSIRSVLVLPLYKTSILCPDSICVNSQFTINSTTDSNYQFEKWNLDDGTFLDTIPPSKIRHSYSNPGTYEIKLNPYYTDQLKNSCKNSAKKTITVLGVESLFDIDPNSKPPEFKFINKSLPSTASLNWNFWTTRRLWPII
ncbi:MAG: PKD domain-containing protein [Bacteroidia bacterium]